MTIMERVASIRQISEAAKDEDRLKITIGQFKDLTEQMRVTGDDLRRVSIALTEMRPVLPNIATEEVTRVDAIVLQLDNVREQVAQSALDEGIAAAKQQGQIVDRFTQAIKSQLREAWSAHIARQQLPAVDLEFLETLRRAGVDVDAVRSKVDDAHSDISLLSMQDLPRKGDLEKLASAVRDLDDAVTRVSQAVPAVVARFFKGAHSTEGAPLNLYTEDVRDFLDSHGLAQRYRIRGG
jgi:hypothetical protein